MHNLIAAIVFLSFASLEDFDFASDRFRVDDLGYLYAVGEQELVKYDQVGKELFIYSRMDLGPLSQLDVSDPLRPLLFFEETGTLVALDNTLSEQRVLRLWEGGMGMPSWVASGVNQEFWVYDALNKELLRIDERMTQRASSGYLPVITGHDPAIVGMAERHEQLIVADKNYGLWVLDRFGTLVRRIPIQGIEEMRTHASGLVLKVGEDYFWMRYGEVQPLLVEVPHPAGQASSGPESFWQADMDAKYIYVLRNRRMQIYRR